jgi:hypothetical protein
MTRLFSHKNRPVHLGSYPLERLARQQNPTRFRRETPPLELQIEDADNPHSLANGMREYVNVMDRMRAGPVAPSQAPIPTDLQERANHLKAACYYLDASMVGVCRIPEGAALEEPVVNHSLTQAMEREYGTGSADNPMAEISVREGPWHTTTPWSSWWSIRGMHAPTNPGRNGCSVPRPPGQPYAPPRWGR